MVVTVKSALKIQESLSKKVVTTGDPSANLVCGVDVAYAKDSDQLVGVAVLLDTDSLSIVETAVTVKTATFEYVPGLFSFREVPPLLEVIDQLTRRPDLIICDGHGYAHPRRIGLASHLGVLLSIPTIGCAKKLLLGEYEMLNSSRGATSAIFDNGEQVGFAVRTQTNVKEVFVSPGHLIGFEEACRWVLKLAPKFRLPETTRQADQLANARRKDLYS